MMHAALVADVPPLTRTRPVLLVDGRGDDAATLDRRCRRLGVTATTTAAADVGLAVTLRRLRPAAVICDLAAAGDDALALLRTLAHYDPDLPVLAIAPRRAGSFDAGAPPISALMLARLRTTHRPVPPAVLQRFLDEARR